MFINGEFLIPTFMGETFISHNSDVFVRNTKYNIKYKSITKKCKFKNIVFYIPPQKLKFLELINIYFSYL